MRLPMLAKQKEDSDISIIGVLVWVGCFYRRFLGLLLYTLPFLSSDSRLVALYLEVFFKHPPYPLFMSYLLIYCGMVAVILAVFHQHDQMLLADRLQEVQHARQEAKFRSQFLATMSHELRTPLNGILGGLDLLFETILTPQQEDYAAMCQECTEQMLTLVNDFLDVSKMEAGKLKLQSKTFDVVRLVETVLEQIYPRAQKKGLELISQIDPMCPELLNGDASRLTQILLNLMNNATKFTEIGHVIVRVSVASFSVSQKKVIMRFEVQDSGIGIAASDTGKLFARFSQLDNSLSTRRYDGTGLGLVICKDLIELMNGEISVVSSPGKGSTFWFTAELEYIPSPHQVIVGTKEEDDVYSLEQDDDRRSRSTHDDNAGVDLADLELGAFGKRKSVASLAPSTPRGDMGVSEVSVFDQWSSRYKKLYHPLPADVIQQLPPNYTLHVFIGHSNAGFGNVLKTQIESLLRALSLDGAVKTSTTLHGGGGFHLADLVLLDQSLLPLDSLTSVLSSLTTHGVNRRGVIYMTASRLRDRSSSGRTTEAPSPMPNSKTIQDIPSAAAASLPTNIYPDGSVLGEVFFTNYGQIPVIMKSKPLHHPSLLAAVAQHVLWLASGVAQQQTPQKLSAKEEALQLPSHLSALTPTPPQALALGLTPSARRESSSSLSTPPPATLSPDSPRAQRLQTGMPTSPSVPHARVHRASQPELPRVLRSASETLLSHSQLDQTSPQASSPGISPPPTLVQSPVAQLQSPPVQTLNHTTSPPSTQLHRHAEANLAPASVIVTASGASATSAAAPVDPDTPEFPIRVLSAEDNEINQKMLTATFKSIGLEFKIVENGLQCVQAFLSSIRTNTPYDVILLDCQMPVMNGYDAAREIRTHEKQHDLGRIPIVACTADATEGAIDECLGAGMDAYITKPVRKKELQTALFHWVAQGRRVKQQAITQRSARSGTFAAAAMLIGVHSGTTTPPFVAAALQPPFPPPA
eukprot:TRINITY_DN7622_c0_g1_i1.p1 TRINITY_DN7622_c0_g1~~TRINITY_DN7622_c0_g1_i1.p1  ORF type:complete len:979 (+),score=202.55 TRINITY_DN7622_c0_g1_i1:373-3309(+)